MQRFIRLAQLASTKNKDGLLPMSAATIWRKVKSSEFPRPIKLSTGITAWDAADVEGWLTRQKGAAR